MRNRQDWTTPRLVDAFGAARGAELAAAYQAHAARGGSGVEAQDKNDRPHCCTSLGMLNTRSLKNLLRNKMLFAARVGQVRPRS